jgi:hypothetical protein
MTKLGRGIIQAAIGALLTITALHAAAEPYKLAAGLLGEWCQIGGSSVQIDQTGKITGDPAHWTYRRGRCSNPHYRMTVRSNA